MEPRLDCVYYVGEKPCKFKRLCKGCVHYQSMGIRILILKLGAIGDALRTTSLLPGLKRKFPVSSIIWVTDRESYPILKGNPLIDTLLINRPEETFPLLVQRFDMVICLDKDPSVTSLAMKIDAIERLGFAMSPYGTLDVFNDASTYALMLGLDDDLKFRVNRMTYQQIICEMADIPFERDPYIYHLPAVDEASAARLVESLESGALGPRIGLNTGCGTVFATKKWPDVHFTTLARMLREQLDARVFLLGGNAEADSNQSIAAQLDKHVINAGSHSLGVFAGLLKQMDVIVSADTMALHLAMAVDTPVIGLFGSTCAQEIDFYDRGEAITVSCQCSPCYRKTCTFEKSCMYNLQPQCVFDTLAKYVS